MAKRGHPKHIKTPEMMWELFLAYKKEVKDNPFFKIEQKKATTIFGKGANMGKIMDTIELPIMRPLTLEGFENYCADKGVIQDLGDYFGNRRDKYTNYSAICSRIKRVIRQDQIEGGMAGLYNPSITQRLNGLVDRVQEDGNKDITIRVKYERKGNKPD